MKRAELIAAALAGAAMALSPSQASADEHVAQAEVGVQPGLQAKVTASKSITVVQHGFGCAGGGAGPRLATEYFTFTGWATRAGAISCPAHAYKERREVCETKYGNYGSEKTCRTVAEDKFGDNRSMSFAAGAALFSYRYEGSTVDYCTGQRLTGSRDENANTGTGVHYYGMTASDAAKYQAKVRRDFQSEYAGCSGVPALSFQ